MRCYWFSVSWMLVYRYRGATVLVDITFQEGEHIDLFIGWQNKRDELYGWRVFSASFVELLLRWIMYTCLQNIVSNCKGRVFINFTLLSFLSFATVILKLLMIDGHDFPNVVKRFILLIEAVLHLCAAGNWFWYTIIVNWFWRGKKCKNKLCV